MHRDCVLRIDCVVERPSRDESVNLDHAAAMEDVMLVLDRTIKAQGIERAYLHVLGIYENASRAIHGVVKPQVIEHGV